MKLLLPSGYRPLSSPRRVTLLVGALAFWFMVLFLVLNHEFAVERLPDTPPVIVSDGVVYQSTDYSCGPACLATIFRQFNIIKSEREWADMAGTMISAGTHLPGLIRAGENISFEPVELNPTWEQLKLIGYPAIIFQSRVYHLVTFWGKNSDGNAIIRDPVLGRTVWGPAKFTDGTPGRPVMLVYYPGPVPQCVPDSQPIEIARFQNMLAATSYYSGPVSGKWNHRFSDAIRFFQDDMFLETTGMIDPATSIYLEGAWRITTRGPIEPLMAIDRMDIETIHTMPILTNLPAPR